MNSEDFYNIYWKEDAAGWTPRDLHILPFEEKLVVQSVHRGMSVLEIGCGDGRIGSLVRNIGAEYRGLDISEEAIKLARDRKLDVSVWDVSSSFPDDLQYYDVVICFEVLEHLFRPDEVGRRVRQVLRNGGFFIGSVPNVVYLPHRITTVCGTFSPGGSPATSLRAPWRDPHIRFFSPVSLKRMLLQECGFSKVTIQGSPFYLANLPVLYRLSCQTQKWLSFFGKPLCFLGQVWPSMFSYRVYFSATT